MENFKLTEEKLKSITIEYDNYGKKRFVIVTEWGNAEGYTVDINDENTFNIGYKDFDALKLAVESLNM